MISKYLWYTIVLYNKQQLVIFYENYSENIIEPEYMIGNFIGHLLSRLT